MANQSFKNRARGILDPVVSLLASLAVPPLLVSIAGLVFSLYGAVELAEGALRMAAVWLIVSGLCDVLDGDLARRRGSTSTFGAFIDSTLDRVVEFAYFGAVVVWAVNKPGSPSSFEIIVTLVALAGSVLTSYARARAEGLGLECKVGLMERPERIVLLTLGLLLGYRALIVVITILAATSVFTFIQRIAHVHRVAGQLDTDQAASLAESTASEPAAEQPESPTV